MTSRLAPLALTLVLSACLSSPPVLRGERVAVPTVPPLAATPDAATFGWLRAHQLVRMLHRVGADSVLEQIKVAVDPSQVDPEKPLVVVVGQPPSGEGGLARTPLQAVLPVAPDSRLAGMAQALLGPNSVAPFDGETAVSYNAPPVDETHGAPLLRTLAHAPLVEDLELVVHAAAITTRYAREIAQGLDEMKAEMLKPQGPGRRPLDPVLADAYVGWLHGYLDRVATLTVGFGAGDKDLELFTVTRDKAAPATPAATETTSLPDLAQFVAPGDLRMVMGGDGMQRLNQMGMTMYASMFKDAPQTYARLQAIADEWMRGNPTFALGLDVGGEHFIHGSSVIVSDNAAKQFDALRDAAALANDPAMQKWMHAQGTDLSVEMHREARKVKGWPVDDTHYSVKVDPAVAGDSYSQAMRKAFATGFDAEYARVGSYIVMTFNEPPAKLDKIVDELMAGKGSAPPLAARLAHPAGGWLYGDVDVPRFLGDVAALLPEEKRGEVPKLDEGIAPSTIFGYSTDTVGYYRVQVPERLVDNLREASRR